MCDASGHCQCDVEANRERQKGSADREMKLEKLKISQRQDRGIIDRGVIDRVMSMNR